MYGHKMKLLVVYKIITYVLIRCAMSSNHYRNEFKYVCGQSKQMGRIVGGTNANLGEVPWMARIGINVKKFIQFFCGGSLITDRHVLTAQHCFTKEHKIKMLVVSLGDHNNEKISEACDYNECADPPVINKVKKISSLNFDDVTFQDDITVLHLVNKVIFTRWISPICLPDNISTNVLIGENVIIIGFGLVNSKTKKNPPVLQKVTITIKSMNECNPLLKDDGHAKICAGGLFKDSCNGDSGGPLFKLINGKNGPRYIQLGIVSYGLETCGYLYPAIYTDVSYYLDWIDYELDG